MTHDAISKRKRSIPLYAYNLWRTWGTVSDLFRESSEPYFLQAGRDSAPPQIQGIVLLFEGRQMDVTFRKWKHIRMVMFAWTWKNAGQERDATAEIGNLQVAMHSEVSEQNRRWRMVNCLNGFYLDCFRWPWYQGLSVRLSVMTA